MHWSQQTTVPRTRLHFHHLRCHYQERHHEFRAQNASANDRVRCSTAGPSYPIPSSRVEGPRSPLSPRVPLRFSPLQYQNRTRTRVLSLDSSLGSARGRERRSGTYRRRTRVLRSVCEEQQAKTQRRMQMQTCSCSHSRSCRDDEVGVVVGTSSKA
jgi:hypothetical protein